METLTYILILSAIFFAGILLFTYFETPRKQFNKGMKKLKNIQVLTVSKMNKNMPFTIGGQSSSTTTVAKEDIKVFVHEY